jgi:hypothetical protein
VSACIGSGVAGIDAPKVPNALKPALACLRLMTIKRPAYSFLTIPKGSDIDA